MRPAMTIGLSVAVLAFAAGAQAAKPRPAPRPPAAAAAAQHAVAASYRTRAGHGYSARDRHIADCLATYRRYDPRTDTIRVRPGVSRRCGL